MKNQNYVCRYKSLKTKKIKKALIVDNCFECDLKLAYVSSWETGRSEINSIINTVVSNKNITHRKCSFETFNSIDYSLNLV